MTNSPICFILIIQATSACTHDTVTSSGEFIVALDLAVAPLSTFFSLPSSVVVTPVRSLVRIPLVSARNVCACVRAFVLDSWRAAVRLPIEPATTVPPLAGCCCCSRPGAAPMVSHSSRVGRVETRSTGPLKQIHASHRHACPCVCVTVQCSPDRIELASP